MPREIGLGDSLTDQDIDGDIDFDFFDDGQAGGDSGNKENCIRTAARQGHSPPVGNAGDWGCHGDNNPQPAVVQSGFKAGFHNENGVKTNFSAFQVNRNEASDLKNSMIVPSNVSVISSPPSSVSQLHFSEPGTDVSSSSAFHVAAAINETGDSSACFLSNDIRSNREVDSKVSGSVEAFSGAVLAALVVDVDDQVYEPLGMQSQYQMRIYEYDSDSDDDDSENSLDVIVTESDSSILSDDSLENVSDSEMTDVTPLSSCNISPMPGSPQIRKLGLLQGKRENNVKFVEEKRSVQEAASKASTSVDLNLLVEAIIDMEKDRKRKVLHPPKYERLVSARPRKNMSFTNDEVRKIDHENHLLLKKILDKQAVARGEAGHLRPPAKSMASSAINRLRLQKKIEAENLMLLKRIQSAKPSKELSRTHLLKSHEHLRTSHSAPVSRPVSQSSLLKMSSSRSSEFASSPSASSRMHSRSCSASSVQSGSLLRTSPTKSHIKNAKALEGSKPEWNSRIKPAKI